MSLSVFLPDSVHDTKSSGAAESGDDVCGVILLSSRG
jgi:hypothetical protein